MSKTYGGNTDTQFEVKKKQGWVILSIHTYDGTEKRNLSCGDEIEVLNVVNTHSVLFNGEEIFKKFCQALTNIDLDSLNESNSQSFRIK